MAGRKPVLTLSVASRADVAARMQRAMAGDAQGDAITFASLELLWKVLTPRRLEILRTLTGADPLAIREIARRVGRDVKAVHGDVHALIDAGILDQTPNGVRLGYDAIHVDFTLHAA